MTGEMHYWKAHGTAWCGYSVWDGENVINVIRIMRFTLRKTEVTCDKCKKLLAMDDA